MADDQDDMAAAWEAEMTGDGGGADDAFAAEWEAMVGAETGKTITASSIGIERVLNQDEIDNLLGFDMGDENGEGSNGINGIINSALVSYERLPMLEIVFDRLVRYMTTSLRNFTSDNVEVSLDHISSIRFGDYLNSIPVSYTHLDVYKRQVQASKPCRARIANCRRARACGFNK